MTLARTKLITIGVRDTIHAYRTVEGAMGRKVEWCNEGRERDI